MNSHNILMLTMKNIHNTNTKIIVLYRTSYLENYFVRANRVGEIRVLKYPTCPYIIVWIMIFYILFFTQFFQYIFSDINIIVNDDTNDSIIYNKFCCVIKYNIYNANHEIQLCVTIQFVMFDTSDSFVEIMKSSFLSHY